METHNNYNKKQSCERSEQTEILRPRDTILPSFNINKMTFTAVLHGEIRIVYNLHEHKTFQQ